MVRSGTIAGASIDNIQREPTGTVAGLDAVFALPATPIENSQTTLSNLLSENSGAKCRPTGLDVLTFPITENPEATEVIQQFVVIQQVGGIFRMADRLLIDQIGFKDNVTLGLERSSDLRKLRSLQIIKIHDQIVGVGGKFNLLQVRLAPGYLE